MVDEKQTANPPTNHVYGNNCIFGKSFLASTNGIYLKDAIDNFCRAFNVPKAD